MTHGARELAAKRCKTARDGLASLSNDEVARLLVHLPDWTVRDGVIARSFSFPDYGQTIAFVNATAWVSQREDHHPNLVVGYNTCRVEYSTHSVQGISENDFICAAKLDALFA